MDDSRKFRPECALFMIFLCRFMHSMSSSAAVIVSPEKISSLSDQQSCPKVCTCLDTHVDCSHRHLQTIPVPIPTWATTLELQGNALIAINRTVFIGLSKLNTLDISENGIQSFSRMVFAHIPYLRTLILRKNRLSAVPIGIEFLDSLVRLDLRSNMIKKLSVIDVQRLARISYVDLGRNQLTEWPNASIIDMLNCKIVKLDLSNNALTTLRTDTFSNLRSLQVLKLSRNKISRIESGAFRGMTALHSLNLARNRISSIDRFSFEMLVSLENLTLSRNSVSFIEDASFWSLEKLRRLDLSGNRLKSITRGWMYGLRFLIAIDASSNELDWIEPSVWKSCPSLEWLSLAFNRIRALPPFFFKRLNNLRFLSVAGNRIDVIHSTSMSGLDKLEFLDLSDNALSVCVEDGSVLANTTFPFLRTLKLSSNRIRIIPSRAFERFPSLKILDLSDNPIASVQEGAFDPLSLDTLIINTSSVLCDCELKWLSSWLRSSGLDSRTVSIICLYPTSVRSMALNSLDTSQLTCVDESPRARLLDHPVSLIKALTRSSVHLKCRGYGAAPLDIMWKVIQKGRTRTLALDATTDLTVNRTSVNGSSSEYSQEYLSSELVLTQVDLNDQAEYQCVVRNNYGTDYSLRSKLVVLEKPQIRQGPSNISVLKGHSIWLKCSVQGIPSPIVKWQKDGGDTFPAATERRLHVKLDDDNLYVVNVSIADSGLYTCRAINEAGRDESSAFVHVYDYQFRSKLKDQTTQLGDSVVFDCSAGMHPPVTINWYHNGIRISHFSPRFSLKGNSQLLIINKVRSSDSGLYRCQIDVDGKTLTAQSAHLFIDNAYLNEDSYKRGPDELLVLHEYLLTVISRICLLLASILVLAVILSTILLWRSRRHPTNTAAPTSATVLDEVRRTSTTEMPSSVQISGEKLFEICSAI